ncbi:hypothetical protein DES53_102643 [Roseimicrobium gellanilyticum]|uniref:Uncharacterized protein n=1 Tax=Roseimicrobium gellanilyticum TaxID=748857 RepID=A0A366HRY2_9BACT|nr:hypothetical protein [Roseimicrobium gellanilyticum]RBP46256.1 hypothetical protein DES53_102643 [Roseimicrobium gellanilyticum]
MKALLIAAFLGLAAATTLRAEDAKLVVGQFTFALPAPWKQAENTGMMTKAIVNYQVEGGSKLEAKYYDFGGPSGGVEANIKRWIGQFEGTPEVKREDLEKNGTKIALLTATGTFLDGAPMSPQKTPRPGYTMLGAVLEGSDSSCFIKLTGPKDDVAKMQEAFKKMALSPFEAK